MYLFSFIPVSAAMTDCIFPRVVAAMFSIPHDLLELWLLCSLPAVWVDHYQGLGRQRLVAVMRHGFRDWVLPRCPALSWYRGTLTLGVQLPRHEEGQISQHGGTHGKAMYWVLLWTDVKSQPTASISAQTWAWQSHRCPGLERPQTQWAETGLPTVCPGSQPWAWCSVQFSRSAISDSLWPHESQHARPPCPSPTPGVHPDSCP